MNGHQDPIAGIFSREFALQSPVVRFTEGILTEVRRVIVTEHREVVGSVESQDKGLVVDQDGKHEGNRVDNDNEKEGVVTPLQSPELLPPLPENRNGLAGWRRTTTARVRRLDFLKLYFLCRHFRIPAGSLETDPWIHDDIDHV